jgi:serine/threonine-protein kinase
VKPGDMLAGKWRVERVLGIGGMGVVVAARHVQLDQRVAVKFLLPAARKDPEVMTRFAREAKAAAKLAGPHVARVLDVGTLDEGSPYMVMEYLEGTDLARVIRERGALPVREAVDHVVDACDALAEAHALGIVHRDVKPANMFLARQPDGTNLVKVIDFGISKLADADGGITRTTAVIGSPLYMSPEQLAATRTADARSDVWSLGVTLYELLTGAPPFRGETIAQLVASALHREPPPPSTVRPEIPRELDLAVMKCLRKDAGKRYPGVAALATALAPFGGERAAMIASRATRVTQALAVTANATAAVADSIPAGSRTVERSWSLTGARTSTRRGVLRALSALVAGVAIAGVGILALHRTSPAPALLVDAEGSLGRATTEAVAATPLPSVPAFVPSEIDARTAAPVDVDAGAPKAHAPEKRNPLRPQLK